MGGSIHNYSSVAYHCEFRLSNYYSYSPRFWFIDVKHVQQLGYIAPFCRFRTVCGHQRWIGEQVFTDLLSDWPNHMYSTVSTRNHPWVPLPVVHIKFI